MDNDISEKMIQQQMQETRASLTEKLETLELKVVGTVENATAAVNETVDAIKETVHETVATVQDGVQGSVNSVKDLFDVPAHVERHPCLMVGASVAVGYCIGALLTQSSPSPMVPVPIPQRPYMPGTSNRVAAQYGAEAALSTSTASEPSLWGAEVAKLKGLALGVLFGTARELLLSSMPSHMGEQLKDVVDSVTRKVGGQPLPSSDWAKLLEPTSHDEPAAQMPDAPPSEKAPGATSQPFQAEIGNGHRSVRRW